MMSNIEFLLVSSLFYKYFQLLLRRSLGSVNISEEETKRVKSDSVRFDKEHTLSICIITLKRKIGNIFLGYWAKEKTSGLEILAD